MYNNNAVNDLFSYSPSPPIDNHETPSPMSLSIKHGYNYRDYYNYETGEASTSTSAGLINGTGSYYFSGGSSRNNIYSVPIARCLREEWIAILNEAREHFEGMAANEHGRLLLYNIIMSCGPYEIQQFVDAMIGMNHNILISMCTSEEGMRLVQVLINGMKTDQQQHSFVSALLRHTHLLTTDKNGSNVVYLCISHFTTEQTLGIVDMLIEHCVGIAKDRHGCHVLQECFRKYANEQSILRSFLDNLISGVVNLASHAYGNYVIQCLIMMNIPHGVSLVVSHIMDYIVELSMDNNRFLDVLGDAVGNYVAQRAIVTAWEVKANTYYDLRNRIMSMYSFLRRDLFGEWVLGTLKHPRKMRLRGNQGRFVYF